MRTSTQVHLVSVRRPPHRPFGLNQPLQAPPSAITTHLHIDVDLGGERSDPRSFNWASLQYRLAAFGDLYVYLRASQSNHIHSLIQSAPDTFCEHNLRTVWSVDLTPMASNALLSAGLAAVALTGLSSNAVAHAHNVNQHWHSHHR